MIVACIDIGSTWTKGASFRVDGRDTEIVARAAQPTTVNNLAEGFFAVLNGTVGGEIENPVIPSAGVNA